MPKCGCLYQDENKHPDEDDGGVLEIAAQRFVVFHG
jgi:hypothetical protein